MNFQQTKYRVLFICLVALMSQVTLLGQGATGEFCVEAFEDRDGNGVHDAGEPFLTRGLSAQLSDANGIVIQTALIDNSPTAGRGLICFQAPPAQYTLSITSSEFVATTTSNLTVNLAENDRLLLEYGGQRAQVAPAESANVDSDTADSDELRDRALIAGAGALIAMFITLLIGLFLYFIFLRGRGRRQPQYAYNAPPDDYRYRPPSQTRTGTGTNPMVRPPTDTGQYQAPTPTPHTPPTVTIVPDIDFDEDDDDSGFDFDTGELPKI